MNKLKIVAVLFGLGFSACTPGERLVAKTAVDVAEDACRFAFGQRPEELPAGVSLEDFCHSAEHYQPFLDNILSARRSLATKLGTRPPTDVAVDAGTD